MEALIARFEFPVPEFLVQQQIDVRLDRGLRALAAAGHAAEDMRKLDFDRLRSAQRDSALAEVKGLLILDKIADAEQIQVSDEEVEQQLQLISVQSREPLETLRARLTEEGGIARIREQLRREKTGAVCTKGCCLISRALIQLPIPPTEVSRQAGRRAGYQRRNLRDQTRN